MPLCLLCLGRFSRSPSQCKYNPDRGLIRRSRTSERLVIATTAHAALASLAGSRRLRSVFLGTSRGAGSAGTSRPFTSHGALVPSRTNAADPPGGLTALGSRALALAARAAFKRRSPRASLATVLVRNSVSRTSPTEATCLSRVVFVRLGETRSNTARAAAVASAAAVARLTSKADGADPLSWTASMGKEAP